MAGYVGWSKSRNAVIAEEKGGEFVHVTPPGRAALRDYDRRVAARMDRSRGRPNDARP